MAGTEVKLTNRDGSSTAITHFQASEESNTVIVIFPAMGIFASYYENLGSELAKNGFHAITADLRGNGKSSIRPSKKVDFGYAGQLDQEYTTVLNHVEAEFPDKRVLLLGHSLGGQLGCLMASRKTHKIDGLMLVACCSVYYKGWDGMARIRTLFGTQFLGLVSSIMGYLPGKQVGFGGLEARTVIKDWSRQARNGYYVLANDLTDYEAELAKLEIPVMAVSMQGDYLAPAKAVNHLLGKMKGANIEHLHLKKDDPRNDGYNHFNWAKKPTKLVGVVSEWITGLN